MKSLKELGARALYIIAGLLITGFGVSMTLYYINSDKNYADVGLKIGFGAILVGIIVLLFGFSSKKEYDSFNKESSSPDKKEEQPAPLQNEKKPPPLP